MVIFELEPHQSETVVENGNIIEKKPFYIVYSNIESLALLDEGTESAN